MLLSFPPQPTTPAFLHASGVMSHSLPKQKFQHSYANSKAANNASLTRSSAGGISAPPRANAPSAPEAPPLTGTNIKKRKTPTKPKTPRPPFSSTTSSPVMGGPMMSDSDHNKKHNASNKLGYQRIAVACAHCRRRKIRCVVKDDDYTSGAKCLNCVRLKKDCHFTPVEHDGKSPKSSKISASEEGSVTSSSDSPSRDHTNEDTTATNNYNGLPIEPIRTLHGHDGYSSHSTDFAFHSPEGTRHSYGSTGENSPTMMASGPTEPYWQHPRPMTIGEYPSAHGQTAPYQSGAYEIPSVDEQLWHHQQNSLYGQHVESVPSNNLSYDSPYQQGNARTNPNLHIDVQRATPNGAGGPLSAPLDQSYFNGGYYALPSFDQRGTPLSAPLSQPHMHSNGWYNPEPSSYEPMDEGTTTTGSR